MKNILITGARGFIGRNMTAAFMDNKDVNLFLYDIENELYALKQFILESDFIFHFAGVNMPKEDDDFEGNLGSLQAVLQICEEENRFVPIVLTSSVQADYDNPFGLSKKKAEEALIKFGMDNDVKVYVYRLKNVFGKWCRPNYNSAISTFCYNIANDKAFSIPDRDNLVNLVYIDDIMKKFVSLPFDNYRNKEKFYHEIDTNYSKTYGEITDILYNFKNSRDTLKLPNMEDEFQKKLYSTYLSYLPKDKFGYDLQMNVDVRGSFTEFVKSDERGQVSINITKPGISKGNHWHHTKTEKFLVVSGKGVIRFRQINSDEVIEYFVSGEKLQVIDIPPGYTHHIMNIGSADLVTVMWANENYDPENSDTHSLEV